MSDIDLAIIKKKENADLIFELCKGNAADVNMLTNERENVSIIRQAASFRQKELFVDMIIHIAVHSRYHGQCPLEWIWKISSLLKDGGLSDVANNNLGRISIGYSAVISRDIEQSSLPTYYDQKMQDIRVLIEQTEVESESGNSFKSYIWVLMVDNYANTKYAAEQTARRNLHLRLTLCQF